MSPSPSQIRAIAFVVAGIVWAVLARMRELRAAPWRGLIDTHNKKTLLVVAKGAANPEGMVASLRAFNTVAELYEFAFDPKRGFEMLMLWRSPATEDGEPFQRRPGEADSDCLVRLAGELHVTEAEKRLPPARRPSQLKQLAPLFVMWGVAAALWAGTFFTPTPPTPPLLLEAPDPPDPADMPPAEELCRTGVDRALCEPAKAAQRGLNGNDCASAVPAVNELRRAFDGLPEDQQTVPARRAVRALEHRRDRRCAER